MASPCASVTLNVLPGLHLLSHMLPALHLWPYTAMSIYLMAELLHKSHFTCVARPASLALHSHGHLPADSHGHESHVCTLAHASLRMHCLLWHAAMGIYLLPAGPGVLWALT
jgi:hypothetical protein